jgi:hypothetical protein
MSIKSFYDKRRAYIRHSLIAFRHFASAIKPIYYALNKQYTRKFNNENQ